MFVHDISSYFDITCIVSLILTIKQIIDKYFSKGFNSFSPNLLKWLI